MRQMQKGTHMGKLIIVPGIDNNVNVVSRDRPLRLDALEGTCLAVGGIGGISKAIAEWFVEKGARNVLVISRSAASHHDAQAMISSAKEKGCALAIRYCDVGDETQLQALVASIAGEMPPIRGVIQAAMVLDVSSTPIHKAGKSLLTLFNRRTRYWRA